MKIAIIGCGNMGSALARNISRSASLVLSDRNTKKGELLAEEIGARHVESPKEAVQGADWVILAIKPKDLPLLASELTLEKDQLLVSLLSGTRIDTLRKRFPSPSILRMMPNTAVGIGKGIVGLSEEGSIDEKTKREVAHTLGSLGHLHWIAENKMDAFAALAASSPAFGFVIMEAMTEAGISLGFSANESREIVLSVFEGCSALLRASSKHPAELKLQITSPGGTTIEGIYALEAGGIRKAIFDALNATYQKAVKMSRE